MRALPSRLFCDTSFFYACLDPRDSNHEKARSLLEDAFEAKSWLFTTWDVIGETVTLLRYRRSFPAASTFILEVKPGLRIVDYGERVRTEAERAFLQLGRDRRLSWCDCVSLVVVTAILDDAPCLAFDEDFRALGLTVVD